MDCKRYFVSVFAIVAASNAVKVDMQGSLSLGKEVLDTISYYLRENYIDGRRSMPLTPTEEDNLYVIVNTAYLCHNLNFCPRNLEKFVNGYVITLAKTIDGIVDGLLNEKNKVDEQNGSIGSKSVFEEQLKRCVRDIKKLLQISNEKISEQNEVYIWIDIIKKICAKFQEAGILFLTKRLEEDPKDIDKLKKKLTQKIVVATVIVEAQYQSKLCSDYNICIQSYECTKELNTLLEQFRNMTDDKVKHFIRCFYEVLPDTTFYTKMSDVTANELQEILNDMTYSNDVPTKDVLLTIQKTVESRLHAIDTNDHVTQGRDIELAHMILSDMDHIYSKHKKEPFYKFMNNFFEWRQKGGRFNTQLRHMVKEISQQLLHVSEELIVKLINEVRVFLEITVDPEK